VVMLAHLETDRGRAERRGFDRHVLRLRAPGSTLSEKGVVVLIHDLSLTGLLMETSAELSVGSELKIQLPEAGGRQARVVWNSGRYFGCEFHAPISRRGLSAALLKSPADESRFFGGDNATGDQEDKLPLRTRFVIIIALALASWAAILTVFALI
jgi:hypothetical protein